MVPIVGDGHVQFPGVQFPGVREGSWHPSALGASVADNRAVCRVGKGLDPGWRDEQSPVPEAGRTGAAAVAAPATPTAGHDGDSPTKSDGLDRWSSGVPGRLDVGQAKAGERPNHERCRSGGFSGGIEGGRSTPRQSAVDGPVWRGGEGSSVGVDGEPGQPSRVLDAHSLRCRHWGEIPIVGAKCGETGKIATRVTDSPDAATFAVFTDALTASVSCRWCTTGSTVRESRDDRHQVAGIQSIAPGGFGVGPACCCTTIPATQLPRACGSRRSVTLP